MSFSFTGTAFSFGDNINTDYIISSRRKRDTLDLNILKEYIMEDIRPGFHRELTERNILITGENFGCGSAMEVATQVVKANNFGAIIAKSFSRSYFRNCINNGLVAVQANTDGMREGDIVSVSFQGDLIEVKDETANIFLQVQGYAENIRKIILAGGIMNDLSLLMG